MNRIKSITKWVSNLFDDYSPLRQSGYDARIYNSDLILWKKYSHFTIHLHQSLEPHNTQFQSILTFNHDGACIVIELHDRRKLLIDTDNLMKMCQNYYDYGGHIFLFDNHMDFGPKNLKKLVEQIEYFLSEA